MNINHKELLTYFPDTFFLAFPENQKGEPRYSSKIYDEEAFTKLNNEKCGIYFSVNAFNTSRKEADLKKLTAVYCDLDVAKVNDGQTNETIESKKIAIKETLLALPFAPNFIITTKNGLQPLWLVQEDLIEEATIKLYKTVLKGIVQWSIDQGGLGDKVYDVSRVLRLPDYLHQKSEPYKVTAIKRHNEKYSLLGLSKAFPYFNEEVITQDNQTTKKELTELDKIDIKEIALQALKEHGEPQAYFDTTGRIVLARGVTGAFQGKRGDRQYIGSNSHELPCGNKITFVQRLLKLPDNKEAYKWIAQKFNIPLRQEEAQQKSIAEQLVDLTLNAKCELFLDEYEEPYISFPENPHIASPIKNSLYKRWLAGKYWNLCKKGFSGDTFSRVINSLEGLAYSRHEVKKLYNRIAKVEKTIYYDLVTGKVVRINTDGWIITTECPVKFRQFPHQLKQVEPESGGNLKQILPFINLSQEQDKLLFLVHPVVSMIPDIPRAAIAVVGDHGGAKSTALRILLQLIDPSVNLLKLKNDTDDVIINANKHYCLYYDNLSYISKDMSDTFSGLVTGIGQETRRLFTNDETVIFSQKVALGFSAIPLIAKEADLLDRLLILHFSEISQDKRETEEVFFKKFNEAKPKILGAIFDCLSQTLKIKETLVLPNKPRMADYATYAAAAAIALGYSSEEYIQAFEKNIGRQNEAAITSSVVAQTIQIFMEDRNEWECASSALHAELLAIATKENMEISKDGFPKHANKLWEKISPIKQNLQKVGIIVIRTRTSGYSTIFLRKSKDNKNAYTAYTTYTTTSEMPTEEPAQPTQEPTQEPTQSVGSDSEPTLQDEAKMQAVQAVQAKNAPSDTPVVPLEEDLLDETYKFPEFD